MIKSIIFIMGLTLVCTNCSATGQIDCQGQYKYEPNDFTEEQKQWIEHAAVRWNQWVGHTVVSVSPGSREVCVIQAGSVSNPNVSKDGQDRHPTEVITIYIDQLQKHRNLNRTRFESVVMHELGHSLGYGHILTGKALMAPSSASDFTDLDRIECIKHGMCTTLAHGN